MKKPIIAFLCGEPSGIGNEILIKSLWKFKKFINSVLIGNFNVLNSICIKLKLPIKLKKINLNYFIYKKVFIKNKIFIINCPVTNKINLGFIDIKNSISVIDIIKIGLKGILNKFFNFIITLPVEKSIINKIGLNFYGYTEYLYKFIKINKPLMMFIKKYKTFSFKIALITTHISFKEILINLNFYKILNSILILNKDLIKKFNINKPLILISGLNPHSGEKGYLGKEELYFINPVIKFCKNLGINIKGPYPSDTIFQKKYLLISNCIVNMYHDQGLSVMKFFEFNNCSNITIGLPIYRNSVCHGTALNLIKNGLGKANFNSLIFSIKLAIKIIKNEKNI